MPIEAMLAMMAISGFHLGITLLALWRARTALHSASREGRADRRTIWRLATLRFVVAIEVLSGGLLALAAPYVIAAQWGFTFLPTTSGAMGAFLVGAWFVWIPATIALDNLALRWLKHEPRSGEPSS